MPSHLSLRPLLVQDFETDGPTWWSYYVGDELIDAVPIVEDGNGNHYLSSQGGWWLDPNHLDPGAGYFNLVSVLYANGINDGAVIQDLRDVTFSFDIRGAGFTLPEGADLYFWFQAIDPKLPWGGGQYVNYVNTTVPVQTHILDDQWTRVSITLTTNEQDWLALGSSFARETTYSASANIADALSGLILDMGLVVLLGNGTPVSAGGTVLLDNIAITPGPVVHVKVNVASLTVPVALGLQVDFAGSATGTYEGHRIDVAYVGPGSLFETLALVAATNGSLLVMGTDLILDGQNVGTVSGGMGTEPLSILLTAPLSAADAARIVAAIGYADTGAVAGSERALTVTLTDPGGATSSVEASIKLMGPFDDGSGNDLWQGGAGRDSFNGGGGADTLNGGGGDDLLFGGNGMDVLNGEDANDVLLGEDGSDTLSGGAGNDRLFGGAGANQLIGGTGDDEYVVDSADDQITEATGEGNDRVYASVSFVLNAGASVETLSTEFNSGTHAIDLTGNELDNLLIGNAGANVLAGGLGNDVLDAKEGDDSLDGGANDDALYGREGNDTLRGGAGTNYLDGGAGDDLYYVDSATDTVVELADQGNDRVYVSFSYTLAVGLSVETLSTQDDAGTVVIDLIGNELANNIIGNAGANILNGGGGEDLLEGGDGNDTLDGGADDDMLLGGAGNDTLYGRAGSNLMAGGSGDDQYVVESAADMVIEEAGEGNDRIYVNFSYALAAGLSVETLSTGFDAGTTAIDLSGNELANTLLGNAGANALTGGGGNDVLEGKDDADTLDGGADDDILYGGAGNDTLYGRGGTNYLEGGAGDDHYVVDNGADLVVEHAGEGNDRVYASVSYALAAGVSVETLSTILNEGGGAIDLIGNELANTIIGNAAANLLDGGAGNDVLEGKDGDDTLRGGANDDILYGGEANDHLHGGTGTNHFEGGAGDDFYYLESATDSVVETAGQGSDRILASLSYTLAAGLSVETLSTNDDAGTAAINLIGNELANTIIGNAGANLLSGGDGSDILEGRDGNDTLDGGANDDALYGGAGNDTLYGRAGTNQMEGGGGDDQYIVDSSSDVVVEHAGEGNDRIYASASYALLAGMSVETLSTNLNAGTASINLAGNALANTVFGNAGSNILDGDDGNDLLDGKEGNDTLRGGAHNDILYGREGNDLLFGGTGTNYLDGGIGDDEYVVESSTDTVMELAGQGNDRVYAAVSFALASGLSVETLSTTLHIGTDAINLTGNELANTITGNAGTNVLNGGGGNDVLDGREGNDTLYGGANDDILYGREGNDLLYGGAGTNYLEGGLGDDQYVIDSATDLLMELAGQGTDRIYASVSYTLATGLSVETMSTTDNNGTAALNLTGNELANTIFGNAGANALSGGAGNDLLDGKGGDDTLSGGAGNDILYGGAGSDQFRFDTALASDSVDLVADFAVGTDKLALAAAIFQTLSAGALSADAFVIGNAAQDAGDRIVYNAANGALFYDADGNGAGAAVQFATLSLGLSLTAGDFLIF